MTRSDKAPDKDLYQNVTDRIIQALEAGAAPWIRPYSQSVGSNVPMNAVTNRPYSGINILLYFHTIGRWPTARFLTYKQAKQHSGQVRKGEHGMSLFFYKQLTIKDKDTEKDKLIPLLREYTVFNVAQVDGLPESIANGPKTVPVTKKERNKLADAFITKTGAKIVTANGTPAYIPSADYIRLPHFEQFHKTEGFYGTAFHELGHWTGAKARLDRNLSGRFGTAQYAAEELIAELTAAFLSAEFGYDNHQQDAAYIATWIKLLKEDKKAIFTAASAAQKAADYLRKEVVDTLEQEAEAA